MRAARAFEARADAAARADGDDLLLASEINPFGIDHFPGVMDGAAQADREMPARGVVAVIALGNGARDAEIALAVGHLADLHIDAVGREESGIDIPARAGARMTRNVNARER